MGQYWIPVNLTKREYIMPHQLAGGLKLWEQIANTPGTPVALFILLTEKHGVGRGGGDFDLDVNWHGPERTKACEGDNMPEDYPAIAHRTIGRWAGDHVVIIGDYADDADFRHHIPASLIYYLCRGGDERNNAERDEIITRHNAATGEQLSAHDCPWFDNITPDVARVIEHELQGQFKGDGWKRWTRPSDEIHEIDPKQRDGGAVAHWDRRAMCGKPEGRRTTDTVIVTCPDCQIAARKLDDERRAAGSSTGTEKDGGAAAN